MIIGTLFYLFSTGLISKAERIAKVKGELISLWKRLDFLTFTTNLLEKSVFDIQRIHKV